MKTHKILAVLLTILGIFAVSCSDVTETRDSSPEIFGFSTEKTYVGDTISIYGDNFGSPTTENYIEFEGEIRVASNDCIEWHKSEIVVEVPEEAKTGTVAIFSNEKSSNKFEIEISKYPPFETVLVPAGKFMMGSDKGLDDEMPIHEVELTKDFLISKHEITQLLWLVIHGELYENYLGQNYPVSVVTWLQAVKFCNKLSEIDELTPAYEINGDEVIFLTDANGWRLPTEAEWEYACRAGTDGDFAGTGNISEMGWFNGNSGFKLHPIGRLKANDFGIHDMHGNVREWCFDYYSEDYYENSPPADPIGPDAGQRRVVRGGSFFDGTSLVRSANRNYPDGSTDVCGLRIVRNNED